MVRDIPDSQHELRDERSTGCVIDLLQQHGFQKRELLKPDGMAYVNQQFLEANLLRSGVRGNLLAHDVRPLATQAGFEQFGFEAQSPGKTLQDTRD
jgi:hypothetical protein